MAHHQELEPIKEQRLGPGTSARGRVGNGPHGPLSFLNIGRGKAEAVVKIHRPVPFQRPTSLITERFNRIQGCGFMGRVVAEKDTDGGGEEHRH